MKYSFILFFLTLSVTYFTYSQDSSSCVSQNDNALPWNGQIGGRYLPSEGTIKALFLFVEFPDD